MGRFSSFRYCHDWDFALQACLISEPLWVPLPLYNYRIHWTNSISASGTEKHLETLIVHRRYFAACRAGNCKNTNAPWMTHWPIYFEKWIANDPALSWKFSTVGGHFIKYEEISKLLNQSDTIDRG